VDDKLTEREGMITKCKSIIHHQKPNYWRIWNSYDIIQLLTHGSLILSLIINYYNLCDYEYQLTNNKFNTMFNVIILYLLNLKTNFCTIIL